MSWLFALLSRFFFFVFVFFCFQVRISDSGGWSSSGPVYSKPDAGQDQPPLGLSPEVLDLLCPDRADCKNRPLLSLLPKPPLRPGLLGNLRPTASPSDDGTYGHKDPVANEPTGREMTFGGGRRSTNESRSARDTSTSVPLTIKAEQLSTVDSISLIHVENVAPLRFPFVTEVYLGTLRFHFYIL